MARLTERLFRENWPRVARELTFKVVGNDCLRGRDGSCPLVAVARDVGVAFPESITEAYWVAFSGEAPLWAKRVASGADDVDERATRRWLLESAGLAGQPEGGAC